MFIRSKQARTVSEFQGNGRWKKTFQWELTIFAMKKLGCLGYIGDYTSQLCGDYKKSTIRIPSKQPVYAKQEGFFRGSNGAINISKCFRCWIRFQRALPLMEEIPHQLIGTLSHYLEGLIHPRWCRISSIHSSTTHLT